jgi:membrane protein implicated in regulation of membrane protease activity
LSQGAAATTASDAGWTEIGVFAIAALVAVSIARRRTARMEEERQ